MSIRNLRRKIISPAALALLALFAQVVPPEVAQSNRQPSAHAQTQTPKPPDDELLRLHVSVTDRQGRTVVGLTQDAFTVYDDKQPREIVSFSDTDKPLTIGLLLDASGSMLDIFRPRNGGLNSNAQIAFDQFLQYSNPANEYFVIGFNQSPQLLSDKSRDPDSVKAALGKLTEVKARGQTAMYDACYVGVSKASSGMHTKRALILITDGQDNLSNYKFEDVRRLLKESDVMVYAVQILREREYALQQSANAILQELTATTGGQTVLATSTAALVDALASIAIELRGQYTLGIKPTVSKRKDGWHEIKVKIPDSVQPASGKPIKMRLRTRQGYYFPAAPR